LIAPIMATIVAMGWNVWWGEVGIDNAKTALRAGSEYYTAGGTVDATAQSVAQGAWPSPPGNASVGSARVCYCAGISYDCSLPCPINQIRSVYVTLTASGTGQGFFQGQTMTQTEVVRVQ
jgi:hypothetical protein